MFLEQKWPWVACSGNGNGKGDGRNLLHTDTKFRFAIFLNWEKHQAFFFSSLIYSPPNSPSAFHLSLIIWHLPTGESEDCASIRDTWNQPNISFSNTGQSNTLSYLSSSTHMSSLMLWLTGNREYSILPTQRARVIVLLWEYPAMDGCGTVWIQTPPISQQQGEKISFPLFGSPKINLFTFPYSRRTCPTLCW